MKLIKLSADHYVIVDDSEIKEDCYALHESPLGEREIVIANGQCKLDKRITHSTQPLEYTTEDHLQWDKIKRLSLSEVKELIGEVDVQQKSFAFIKEIGGTREQRLAYIDGYRDALEDNKDRKYTEQDMRTVFMHGFLLGVDRGDYSRDMEDRAMSHYTEPKTSWEVEFIDGKLKLK